MEYVREGRALVVRRPVDATHGIGLRAETIRQERTGIHARLSILCNDVVLAWSTLNVERDEDRVRLTNSAFAHLNGLSATYPKAYLKKDLDLFCAGLWDTQLAQTAAVEMAGSAVATPPAFLLRPFVLHGGGTILFAPPGRGKSYAMLLMAVSLDAGLDSLWPTLETPVLFINLERSAMSVAQRLGNVNAALGLPRTRRLLTLNARGKSLMDVLASAERAVEKYGVECVFLDSISRAGYGDLNDNRATNGIIDGLNGLCSSWVGLAHTPRNDETHLYGSVHFEAGADVVVQLLSQQEEGGPLGIGLQITKQNDVGKVPMWMHALEFDETGLTAIRPARPGEFPDVESGKSLTMLQKIRDHLLDIGSASATKVAEDLQLNRSNVASLLANNRAFVRIGKVGRDVLYGAAETRL